MDRLGMLLTKLYTQKLMELAEYSEEPPHQLIEKAIDTMYKAMVENDRR